jgi:hypothetical protein
MTKRNPGWLVKVLEDARERISQTEQWRRDPEAVGRIKKIHVPIENRVYIE